VGSECEGGGRGEELEKDEGSSCEVLGECVWGHTCVGEVAVVVAEEIGIVVVVSVVGGGVVGRERV